MSDDVCESWEELEQSAVLDKKLQQLDLKSDSTSAGSSEEAAATGVKILRRPVSESNSVSGSSGHNDKSDGHNVTKWNVNSEPFVPRNLQPVIQLEDSSRTQFQPKLMILKRDKTGCNRKGDPDQKSNAVVPARTLEEREADYIKARQRILGSASDSLLPTPPASDPSVGQRPVTASPTVTSNPRPPLINNQHPEVPLIRQPQGPGADGGKGFNRSKR